MVQILAERRAKRIEEEELIEAEYAAKLSRDAHDELEESFSDRLKQRAALKPNIKTSSTDFDVKMDSIEKDFMESIRRKRGVEAAKIDAEAKRRAEIQEETNLVVNANVSAMARGYTVTKSLIIKNESDPRAMSHQATYAHSINVSHSQYPLLSEGPFSARMKDLHPSRLIPTSNRLTDERIVFSEDELADLNVLRDNFGVKRPSFERITSSELRYEIGNSPNRRISESQKPGRMSTASMQNMKGSLFSRVTEETSRVTGGRRATVLTPKTDLMEKIVARNQDGPITWFPSSIAYTKAQEEEAYNRMSSRELFFSSEWNESDEETCMDEVENEHSSVRPLVFKSALLDALKFMRDKLWNKHIAEEEDYKEDKGDSQIILGRYRVGWAASRSLRDMDIPISLEEKWGSDSEENFRGL